MNSPILQLQQDTINAELPLTAILRKAYAIARKLELSEFAKFLDQELNGYQDIESGPKYRWLIGEVVYHNRFHGYQTIAFENSEFEYTLKNTFFEAPVSEIEHWLQQGQNSANHVIKRTLPNEIAEMITRGTRMPITPELHFTLAQVSRILDSVRSAVLEWTLQLEKDGILGEGLSFSKEEKETARSEQMHYYNIIHDSPGVQIQNASPHARQDSQQGPNLEELAEFARQLLSSLGQLKTESSTTGQLEKEKSNLEVALETKEPGKIRQSLQSLQRILEAASGNLIATGLAAQISKLLTGA